MPSSSTSPVTLPNSVSTPTCPVGTEVTEDHSRMSSTIPPTILPTPSDSQFFGAAMRSVGPRSPGPLLKTFMFASRQNFLRLAKRGAGLAGFETRPLLIVCFFLDTPEPLSQNPASFPGSRAGILTWGYRAVLARLDRTMHQPRLRGTRLVAAR